MSTEVDVTGIESGKIGRLVSRTLERFERELLGEIEIAQVNAVLACASRSLVLPSPAVGLLEIATSGSWKPGRASFRSLEPLGRDGEVWLSCVDPSAETHPWSVRECKIARRVRDLRSASEEALFLRIELARRSDDSPRPGWLYLHLGDLFLPPTTTTRARAWFEDSALPLARVSVAEAVSAGGVAADGLASLTAGLLRVKIPSAALERETWSLDLSLPVGPSIAHDDLLSVKTNVIPVWNSVEASYPALSDIEETAGERLGRRLFPLDPKPMRPGWLPWEVSDVRLRSGGSMPLSRHTAGQPLRVPGWRLALLPAEEARPISRSDRAPLLAVVLDDRAAESLEAAGHRIRIDYQLTQGVDGDGLSDSSEFQAVDETGQPLRQSVRARLVGGTWGGHSGGIQQLDAGAGGRALAAVLPADVPRSVGEVTAILDYRFGAEIELVSPTDLVRTVTESALGPLVVRVRHRRPDLQPWVRRAIRSSCQTFLERYLSGQATGSIHVVEVDGEQA